MKWNLFYFNIDFNINEQYKKNYINHLKIKKVSRRFVTSRNKGNHEKQGKDWQSTWGLGLVQNKKKINKINKFNRNDIINRFLQRSKSKSFDNLKIVRDKIKSELKEFSNQSWKKKFKNYKINLTR